MRCLISISLLVFACVGLLSSTGVAGQPATSAPAASRAALAPARTAAASQPASASAPALLSSGNPQVDALLDRLEAKGKAITDLTADVVNERIDTFPVEDITTDKGVVLFRRLEPNPRFLVRFDEEITGGVKRTDPRWYAFDGVWLIERNDKTRQVIERQMVAECERIDVFKLGKGPFPLPFGQSRHDMLGSFTIVKAPPAGDDPANTDHLICTPRPGAEIAGEFKIVHFYVDRTLELPIRITADRAKDETRVRVTFTNIRLNQGLAASKFEIVKPGDYGHTIEPLPPKSAAPRRP
jgi:hypothetical protein